MHANAELRFPLIEAALTPIGVIGGIRGIFFAGLGGAWFQNQQALNPCTGNANTFRFSNSSTVRCDKVPVGYTTDAFGGLAGVPNPVTGVKPRFAIWIGYDF